MEKETLTYMPLTRTVTKIYDACIELKERLVADPKIQMRNFLKAHNIPSEYSRIMMDIGCLVRTYGGLRGPAEYVWNPRFEITDHLCKEMMTRYNLIRKRQLINRQKSQIK